MNNEIEPRNEPKSSLSMADQLRQRLGLEFDPAGDVFGFPWSTWKRPVRKPGFDLPEAATHAQKVAQVRFEAPRLRAADPRQMELGI